MEQTQPESQTRPAGPALRFVAAALIVRGESVDRAAPCRSADGASVEFPGGKIEAGESPEQALACELDEELGITAVIGQRITHIRHNYRHGGAVDLQFFAVREFSGELKTASFSTAVDAT